VSTNICKSRLVSLKQRDWCLLLSWCLAVGIGVSNRLVSMKICKSSLGAYQGLYQWELVSPIGWCL
jgi:hypothetical protein